MYHETSIFDEEYSNTMKSNEDLGSSADNSTGVKPSTIFLVMASMAFISGLLIYYWKISRTSYKKDKSK